MSLEAPGAPQARPGRKAPAVTREWSPDEPGPRHEPIPWSLVAPTAVSSALALSAALAPWDLREPVILSFAPLELVATACGAMLALFLYNVVREEDRLRARGETQFPDVKRPDRRGVLARTDRVLRGATAELLAGHEATGVLARLEEATHRGDALPPGRARRCYDVAAGIMRVGDGREAARWLRRTRDELSKELMR
jgi:hypothetical protein